MIWQYSFKGLLPHCFTNGKNIFRSRSPPSEGVGRKTGYLGVSTHRAQSIPLLFMIRDRIFISLSDQNKTRRGNSSDFSLNLMDLSHFEALNHSLSMQNRSETSLTGIGNCFYNRKPYSESSSSPKSPAW